MFISVVAVSVLVSAPPASAAWRANAEAIRAELDAHYIALHQAPELSNQERQTAERLAKEMERIGFTVHRGVGGTGLVAILENGAGPALMLRAEMDALPIEERTGLPFASRVKATARDGATVPVMHACGHDLHLAVWLGAARVLAENKRSWRGTLLMIAQPAEEIGEGARAMLAAGLFTRFKRPDFALALHGKPELAAGKVALVPGFALANVDSVDLTIRGRGGHGAYPQLTIDPIVIAAKTVVSLQTIIARENSPLDPAVITVGSIHGGTKHNIIPDEVKLQLTVRSYKDEVRRRLLAAIQRIANAEAVSAGAPSAPAFAVSQGTPALFNDPALTERAGGLLRAELGAEQVTSAEPAMVGEDFSEFGRKGVPALMVWLGTGAPSKATTPVGPAPPSLHSAEYAPDRATAIPTGVRVMAALVSGLLPG